MIFFINIYLFLSIFFVSVTCSQEYYSVNKKRKYIILTKSGLPESRLLINKKEKNFSIIKKNKKELKDHKRKKINNTNKVPNVILSEEKEIKEKKLTKLVINFIPEEKEPSPEELDKFLSKLVYLNIQNSVTIRGYAKKRKNDSTSKVRRLSLKRALYFRSLLLKNNYKISKIYVKALGNDKGLEGNKDVVIISQNQNK